MFIIDNNNIIILQACVIVLREIIIINKLINNFFRKLINLFMETCSYYTCFCIHCIQRTFSDAYMCACKLSFQLVLFPCDLTCIASCSTGEFHYPVNDSCVTECPCGMYGDIQNGVCRQG